LRNQAKKFGTATTNAITSPNMCLLTPTPNPSVFNASPGTLTVEIVPKTGNVAFVPPNCDVTDGSAHSVNPTKTPTTVSFKVVAGQSYHLRLLFDIFPLSSTGTLQEQCSGNTAIDQITQLSNPEVYTIVA
jgi:hypothetical protein